MPAVRCDRPHIVMNFAARAARAGIAHLPKVIFCAKFENPLFGHALRDPQVIGLDIALHARFAFENRHIQLLFIDPEPLR